jgi:hypothetical protein
MEVGANLLVFFVFTVFDALLVFPVVPDVLELLVNYGLLGLGPVGFGENAVLVIGDVRTENFFREFSRFFEISYV